MSDPRFYQLVALKAALRLEIAGMQRSRPPSAYSTLKKMGYRGTRAQVMEQVKADVEKAIDDVRTERKKSELGLNYGSDGSQVFKD